jgi:L,D-peptidoglycan transpeptidase YkuD (ErfK/YbiS/YcfS/YnhG family)
VGGLNSLSSRRIAQVALALAVIALAQIAAGAGQADAAGHSAAAVAPDGISGLGTATQVIEVATNGIDTTHATVRTYERDRPGERWSLARPGMPARVGVDGLSHPARRQAGDGTTPIGLYGFVFDFGSRPDPGVEGFEWRRLVPGSCWSGTRAAYNRWVHRVPCAPGDEDLWVNAARAYRYAAVIDFNYRHPVFGRGSGIFLHEGTGGPTAGCVSLPQADLLAVLRWMRPGAKILIGPSSWLRTLKR